MFSFTSRTNGETYSSRESNTLGLVRWVCRRPTSTGTLQAHVKAKHRTKYCIIFSSFNQWKVSVPNILFQTFKQVGGGSHGMKPRDNINYLVVSESWYFLQDCQDMSSSNSIDTYQLVVIAVFSDSRPGVNFSGAQVGSALEEGQRGYEGSYPEQKGHTSRREVLQIDIRLTAFNPHRKKYRRKRRKTQNQWTLYYRFWGYVKSWQDTAYPNHIRGGRAR